MRYIKQGDTVLVHLTAKWYTFQTTNSFRATIEYEPTDEADNYILNHVPSERPITLNPASLAFIGMELCDEDKTTDPVLDAAKAEA